MIYFSVKLLCYFKATSKIRKGNNDIYLNTKAQIIKKKWKNLIKFNSYKKLQLPIQDAKNQDKLKIKYPITPS